MKSTIAAIGAIIAVLAASLPAASQPIYSWTGLYVGAGVGWDRIESNGRYRLEENGVEIFAFDFNSSGNGVQGQFFAGYGMNWGPWYASGELGIGISSASARVDRSFTAGDFYEATIRLRQIWSITPSVRAGYLLAPDWLIFARFGWAFAYTRLSYAATEIEAAPIVIGATTGRRWLNGPRVGLGVEYAILPQLRLRADWSYTWYNRISIVDQTVLPPPADVDVNFITSRPRQSLLLLGLVYNF